MTTSKRPTRLWIPGLSTEGRSVDRCSEESSTELQEKNHENSIVMHSLIQVLRWFFLFFFWVSNFDPDDPSIRKNGLVVYSTKKYEPTNMYTQKHNSRRTIVVTQLQNTSDCKASLEPTS